MGDRKRYGRRADPRGAVRDHIRAVLAERGHSIREAARRIGFRPDRLSQFLRAEIWTMNDRRIEMLADYLEMPFDELRRWIVADYHRLKRQASKSSAIAEIDGEAMTWWGEVGKPITKPYNCQGCRAAAACRAAADEGRPLPCERFLEKELLPEHAVVQLGASGVG